MSEVPTVALVHGLYLPRWAMTVLSSRLRQAGFHPVLFSYPSWRQGLGANADRLRHFLGTLSPTSLHFVAHSMGGLVVARLLHHCAVVPAGRVVALGTPFLGSHAARCLQKNAPGRLLLGRGAEALAEGFPHWSCPWRLGVIGGTRGWGLGRFVAPGLPSPHDGTVALAETRVRGGSDHVSVDASHSGLLWSSEVAAAVVAFLRTGRFVRGVSC
ncbi:MAG TPA: alpha/beta hydrolase [Gammaproteobacteria bacterium]|nr:alpha/beta hydrolase [Gammaproteobacteria bacterium]